MWISKVVNNMCDNISTSAEQNRICYFLFQILGCFIFFDGVRSNLIGGNILTILREATVFCLLGYTLFIKRYSLKDAITFDMALFFIYHAIVSLLSIGYQSNITASFVVKPFEFVIGVYLFYYFDQLTQRSYEEYLTYLVKVAIVFVVFNTIMYFYYVPIWEKWHPWWGRISCGYPTMDTISLAYILLVLIFYPLDISPKKQTIMTVIVIIGLIIQFTGTGIVVLSAIFLLYTIFCFLPTTNKKHKKNLIIGCFVLTLLGGSFLSYIQEKFPDEYKNGEALILNKFAILTNSNDNTDANTMEIRELQYKKIEKRIDSEFQELIGVGLGNATNDSFRLKKIAGSYMIEDQYSLIKICYGYIGYFLYLLIPLSLGIKVLRSDMPIKMRFLFVGSCIVFLANSKTLVTLVLFPNFMFFPLFISIFNLNSATL